MWEEGHKVNYIANELQVYIAIPRVKPESLLLYVVFSFLFPFSAPRPPLSLRVFEIFSSVKQDNLALILTLKLASNLS